MVAHLIDTTGKNRQVSGDNNIVTTDSETVTTPLTSKVDGWLKR